MPGSEIVYLNVQKDVKYEIAYVVMWCVPQNVTRGTEAGMSTTWIQG